MTKRKITFEQAKAQYVHRFTMEHVPAWALKPLKDHLEGRGYAQVRVTEYYAPQYRTDKEWYDNTVFPGESKLCIASDDCCYSSNQSWPLGKSLLQPYKKA